MSPKRTAPGCCRGVAAYPTLVQLYLRRRQRTRRSDLAPSSRSVRSPGTRVRRRGRRSDTAARAPARCRRRAGPDATAPTRGLPAPRGLDSWNNAVAEVLRRSAVKLNAGRRLQRCCSMGRAASRRRSRRQATARSSGDAHRQGGSPSSKPSAGADEHGSGAGQPGRTAGAEETISTSSGFLGFFEIDEVAAVAPGVAAPGFGTGRQVLARSATGLALAAANVRELEAAIRRAIALCRGQRLELDLLPDVIREAIADYGQGETESLTEQDPSPGAGLPEERAPQPPRAPPRQRGRRRARSRKSPHADPPLDEALRDRSG